GAVGRESFKAHYAARGDRRPLALGSMTHLYRDRSHGLRLRPELIRLHPEIVGRNRTWAEHGQRERGQRQRNAVPAHGWLSGGARNGNTDAECCRSSAWRPSSILVVVPSTNSDL